MAWPAGSDGPASPLELFQSWFELALNSNCHEPTAMSVSTVSSEGRPSSRMVLLKQHDERGFRFATHYESRKAEEVGQTGHASLLFYWGPLNRQIRIEGSVERALACESDEIFARRPRGARLGAWASPQSQPLADRSALLEHAAQLGRDYPGDVPRPPHWGAFILRPDYFEFWEGRDDRLHTRLAYRKQSTGWSRGLLAP